ncbi:MAG: hypothetical protein OEW00_08160 [candidate division Zixibacteria bacterium]|nr:hypothetical protein [candidate division Zixibacteria bacterium]
MRNLFVYIAFTLVGWLLTGSSSGHAGRIESRILQYRFDRLYFERGNEEDIFPGHAFTVYIGADSLFSGYIAESHAGVSISEPASGYFDSISIGSCRVLIETAEVDLNSPVKLGCLSELRRTIIMPEAAVGSAAADSGPAVLPRVVVQMYDSPLEMTLDFEKGQIDGLLHYEAFHGSPTVKVVSAPAPFYAALIPNISKDFNEHGLLTTSLYYRFDPAKLPVVFDGDKADQFSCLYVRDSGQSRPYGCDPAKGRALLRQLKKRPQKVSIHVQEASLEKLAEYFADILSRDRIRAEIASDVSKADLYLRYVPLISNRPDSGLAEIAALLRRDGSPDLSVTEPLTLIENNLAAAQAENDSNLAYYCDLAARRLKEDVGVFGLFRPSITFNAGLALKGYYFNDQGFLDLTRLVKLQLPTRAGE